MKIIKTISIIAISALLLSGCNLFDFKTTRSNKFFSGSELNKYYLKGLPTLTYTDSYLEIHSSKLVGYFNINLKELDKYARSVLDFYENSNLKYGSLLDNDGYMFGIPNLFDALRDRQLHAGTKHLPFYRAVSSTRYAFFYSKSSQIYELLLKPSTEEVNNKTYNFFMEINKVSKVFWNDEYEEVMIADNNIDDYITFNGYVGSNKDAVIEAKVPEVYDTDFLDVNVSVEYKLNGESKSFNFDSDFIHTPVCLGYILDTYQGEDKFVITGKKITKESALIIKKVTSDSDLSN